MNVKDIAKAHAGPVAAGLVFLAAYAPVLEWMWERWFARDSYYSHGILIPFVTAFLIWQKKDELAKARFVPSRWAWGFVLSGLLVYAASAVFRIYFTAAWSMLMVIVGMVLLFYGTAVFRLILFPVLFLMFMIPVPMVVITNISFQMKLLAAQISTEALNSIRIPAIREGSIIRMRHAFVVVDDVCSGLRSLISLAALGAIFAYWMKSRLLKRLTLFISTVPIAIATNVFRVVFLASVSEIWGPERAEGFIHDLSGFLVFALAFVLLYSLMKIME